MAEHDKLTITLKLVRSDCPALYDDIASIKSGARRTMRLRLLAAMGLQNEVRSDTGTPPAARSVAPPGGRPAAHAKGADAAAQELLDSIDMSGDDG